MAVGAPAQHERTFEDQAIKLFRCHRLMRFTAGIGRARDQALRKPKTDVLVQKLTSTIDQTVFANPARSDDQEKNAWSGHPIVFRGKASSIVPIRETSSLKMFTFERPSYQN